MNDLAAIVVGVVAVGVLACATARVVRAAKGRALRVAGREFRRDREMLEAKFFDLAARSGKPRGLIWVDCDWQDAVTFARDAHTGMLTAFVSVEIHFEAEKGGDMEDVAAVGAIRDASAVFHYDGRRWGTGGRALFNMNPHEALERLSGQYEPVEMPSTTAHFVSKTK